MAETTIREGEQDGTGSRAGDRSDLWPLAQSDPGRRNRTGCFRPAGHGLAANRCRGRRRTGTGPDAALSPVAGPGDDRPAGRGCVGWLRADRDGQPSAHGPPAVARCHGPARRRTAALCVVDPSPGDDQGRQAERLRARVRPHGVRSHQGRQRLCRALRPGDDQLFRRAGGAGPCGPRGRGPLRGTGVLRRRRRARLYDLRDAAGLPAALRHRPGPARGGRRSRGAVGRQAGPGGALHLCRRGHVQGGSQGGCLWPEDDPARLERRRVRRHPGEHASCRAGPGARLRHGARGDPTRRPALRQAVRHPHDVLGHGPGAHRGAIRRAAAPRRLADGGEPPRAGQRGGRDRGGLRLRFGGAAPAVAVWERSGCLALLLGLGSRLDDLQAHRGRLAAQDALRRTGGDDDRAVQFRAAARHSRRARLSVTPTKNDRPVSAACSGKC